MRSLLFTSAWNAPAPSAVPSFSHQLAVVIGSCAFAITIHVGAVVFGI